MRHTDPPPPSPATKISFSLFDIKVFFTLICGKMARIVCCTLDVDTCDETIAADWLKDGRPSFVPLLDILKVMYIKANSFGLDGARTHSFDLEEMTDLKIIQVFLRDRMESCAYKIQRLLNQGYRS